MPNAARFPWVHRYAGRPNRHGSLHKLRYPLLVPGSVLGVVHDVADQEPARLVRLEYALRKITGVSDTTTAKLLARKRPKLCPLTDSVVRKAIGAPGSTWDVIRLLTRIRKPELRSTHSALPPPPRRACCGSSTSPSGCCTASRKPHGRHGQTQASGCPPERGRAGAPNKGRRYASAELVSREIPWNKVR